MQKIQYTGEHIAVPINPVESDSEITFTEIINMIRRVVIYTWKDCVFTYDELTQHLANNGVRIPADNNDALHTWYGHVIEEILNSQKELARIAMEPLPIRLHTTQGSSYDDGIVTPYIDRQRDAVAEMPLETRPEIVQLSSIETLAPHEIARLVLNLFVSRPGPDTKIEIGAVYASLRQVYDIPHTGQVRDCIKTLIDLGYLTAHKTGKGTKSHSWLVMDGETAKDVSDEIEEGTLDTGLEYCFASEDYR